MKRALFVLILLLPVWLAAQSDTLNSYKGILIHPEEPAQFPGGHAAMKKFLAENLVYPYQMERCSLGSPEGNIYVRFQVSESGKLSEFSIIRAIPDCCECSEEALRVMQLMPDWIPGSVYGKPTAMWFHLPIKFDPLQ